MVRGALLMIIGLALTACTGGTAQLGPDSDPRAARQLLETAAQSGPVRLESNGLVRASDTTLRAQRLAEQAARGVRNVSVTFTDGPAAVGSARLLLLFDPPKDLNVLRVCTASPLPAAVPSPEPLQLRAVFCDAGTFIADSLASTTGTGTGTGAGAGDIDRLVWRTVGALFPDDYPETYGIRSFFGL
jgi:hypothetical protein